MFIKTASFLLTVNALKLNDDLLAKSEETERLILTLIETKREFSKASRK
jgi:hypothetical protein